MGEALLVAAKVVADQAAPPLAQELACMLASAGLAEVVDQGLHAIERGVRVSPEVGAVRAALAGLEHLHRYLVGVKDCSLEHLVFQGIDQRLQAHAADARTMLIESSHCATTSMRLRRAWRHSAGG
ncbi:hypothetical protein SDC9_178964 [bioreactor metagenome]|uniref:Uncharacterized protein n=1 Tax=bioreactor metagenome TaxID=1076179 RepID=A0A645GYL3_9ZZZZ